MFERKISMTGRATTRQAGRRRWFLRHRRLGFELMEQRWMLSWGQDDFVGSTLNPANWTIVDQDQTYSSGSVAADGSGHLRIDVATTGSTGQVAREYVASAGTENGQSWVYYSSAKFSATAVNRADVRLGYRFDMSDGSNFAYFQFDSRDGMKFSYGSTSSGASDGGALYAGQWYDLKFAWDSAVSTLRAWYREAGRQQWLGGANDAGYLLYSSATTYPERLKIGQTDAASASRTSMKATLLVDFWRQTPSEPAAEGSVTDSFTAGTLDGTLWRDQNFEFTYTDCSVATDGLGHAKVYVKDYTSSQPMPQAYIETIQRFSDSAWTSYTAAAFTSDGVGRQDIDLGFRFDMSDGKSYAYLQFDNRDGMTLKTGSTSSTPHDGPALRPSQWYELKFSWDGTVLRAWYREAGRMQWLGGTSDAGYVLYSSTVVHPERLKIGQTDIGYATGSSVEMTLLVDYWQQTESLPAAEGSVTDSFTAGTLDGTLWQDQDFEFTYTDCSVGTDTLGRAQVYVKDYTSSYPMPQAYIETIQRFSDSAWTGYTAAAFTSDGVGRQDMDLGFRFDMSDGKSYAYLQFDNRDGMTLKTGSTSSTPQDGPALRPSQWYELKFSWDGTVLRAWYREVGRMQWLGGTNDAGYVLYSSAAVHPERLKIGQTDIGYATGSSVEMTLLVDYWQQTESLPAAEGSVTDSFTAGTLDGTLWQDQDFEFTYTDCSVGTDTLGHAQVYVKDYTSSYPMPQAYIETIQRFSDSAWTGYTAAAFTSDGVGRQDMDLGFRFDMSDGKSYAYLQFDNRDGMTLKTGSTSSTPQDGPALRPSEWYELKFSWDGTVLRSWYREAGRMQWLGGTNDAGYVLYSSAAVHPERLKIGQTDIGYATGSSVEMTLLVDYWQQTESLPAAEGSVTDSFTAGTLDGTLWQDQDFEFTYTDCSVGTDTLGHAQVYVKDYTSSYPMPQAYIETIQRFSDSAWTGYTAAAFTSDGVGRQDMDLGFRFDMSDGKSYAYLQFDNRDGMTLKTGSTSSTPQDGPALRPSQWYELKFSWDGTVLRAWYREAGRIQWLGGTNDAGYVLYSSAAVHPERLKIGQADIGYATGSSVEMTLLVDYWQQTESLPAAEGSVTDSFAAGTLDETLWQDQDFEFTYTDCSVATDGLGHAKVYVKNYTSSQPMPQAYIETIQRFSDAAWTAYTAVNFTATAANRADIDLGYRFDMSDGRSHAYLQFDSAASGNLRMKYGHDGTTTVGPTLPTSSSTWYHLKFRWTGSELLAWYQPRNGTEPPDEMQWQGEFVLTSSSNAHPERIKIGQPDIGYATSSSSVTMTLLVDYWATSPVFTGISADTGFSSSDGITQDKTPTRSRWTERAQHWQSRGHRVPPMPTRSRWALGSMKS